jgi:hypothetical protein
MDAPAARDAIAPLRDIAIKGSLQQGIAGCLFAQEGAPAGTAARQSAEQVPKP